MSTKRFALSTLALFVFIFLYEMLVHGFLLKGYYVASTSLWRPVVEMQANMPLMTLAQLMEAFLLSLAFSLFVKQGGLKNGLIFGLIFGVYAGLLNGESYIWLPISRELGFSWFLTALAKGVGAGLILGAISKK